MIPASSASKVTYSPKTMKKPYFVPFAALVLLAASGCDKSSPDVAGRISELERKNLQAEERQRDLERQLEDQRLASERERAKIEEDRASMELRTDEANSAREEAIRQRETALAEREGNLEQLQSKQQEKQDELPDYSRRLSDRERDLAGHEALPFDAVESTAPVGDYGMFYDSLSSYGSWFETVDYGYVWQPVVVRDSGWRPYSRGRWICSDRGWTWVSEEPFGWATYHYGRWALLRGRGWVWVPGSQWAPSWVCWRENDDHIGWAPLPPETLAYRGNRWDSSVEVRFGIGAACFNFVSVRDFGRPVYKHRLPTSGNVTLISQTTNITNIQIQNQQVICGGPRYKEVSARAGRPLPFYRLDVNTNPRPSRDPLTLRPRLQGDRLTVTAPNLDAGWNERLKPARVKERIESIHVERSKDLSSEITQRFRQSRVEGRQKAEQAITDLGGRETFDKRRVERLQENRRQVQAGTPAEKPPVLATNPARPPRDPAAGNSPRQPEPTADPNEKNAVAGNKGKAEPEPSQPAPQEPAAPAVATQPGESAPLPQDEPRRNRPARPSAPGVPVQDPLIGSKQPDTTPRAEAQTRNERPQEKSPAIDSVREARQGAMERRQQAQLARQKQSEEQKAQAAAQASEAQKPAVVAVPQEQAPPAVQEPRETPKPEMTPREETQAREERPKEKSSGADPAREARQEVAERRQQEQEQARQNQLEQQAGQAREAQNQAMKRGQQEEAAEKNQQQQQAEQAREAQQEALARQQAEQQRVAAEKSRDAQQEAIARQQAQQEQAAREEARQRQMEQRQAQEQAQLQQEQAQRQAEQQRQAQEQAQRQAEQQRQQQEQQQPPGQ
jgi:hypothetical protein